MEPSKPDFKGTLQIKVEGKFVTIGQIKLYVREQKEGDKPTTPAMKGYIGLNSKSEPNGNSDKFYEVSLWETA